MIDRLRAGSSLVLEAPPGAGKTTRVPPALDGVVDGQILVLEPRRLAARLAARRLADERGEAVGEHVGYRVRFEEVCGPRTKIVFVTEGLLLRRLLSDPKLDGVGAVVLDEFHERHLQGDLSLALCRRIQRARPSLKLVVMSATLDAAPIAEYLGATTLRAEGRRFDVAIDFLPQPPPPDRPLDAEVAQAVRRLVADGLDGDVLVFLPGAAEIRRAQAACANVAQSAGLDLIMLHGDLPPAEQDRAVAPGPRRKIILSTNVAETSITIEGVVAVVDSGLARVASHSPWSGLPTLRVQRVSRASAAQRAGRAGRLRPGRCLRLYTRHDHDTRPAQETPEVRRADLAEALLFLAAAGERDPARFDWFEAPAAPALDAARTLLDRLGALDGDGGLSELGRRMLRFPVHPRLARMVVEAERRGVGREGCALAALAGESEISRTRGAAEISGPSDLLADLDRFADAERARFQPDRLRSLGLDVGATLAVERVRKQLQRELSPSPTRKNAATQKNTELSTDLSGEAADRALGECVLAGYPDRVARRRKKGSRELVLSAGGTAKLHESSVVDAELMVCIDAEERGAAGRAGAVTVRRASAVEADWLLDLGGDHLRESVEYPWNAEAERVEVVRRLYYDALVLDESRAPARGDGADAAEVARALAEAARARGVQKFVDGEALDRWLGRIAFLRGAAPELEIPALEPADVDAALDEFCAGAASFAELRERDLIETLRARLTSAARRAVDEWAPERITLPGGRGARVQYPPNQAPFIASRLQDFFGLREGPKIARGRVALTLHLLAPNQRAVQVTSDLAGFWQRHYPTVRRELARRYPRHPWPEDPLTARPPPSRS